MGSKVKLDLSALEIPEKGVILLKGALDEMTEQDMSEAAMSVIQAVRAVDARCSVLVVDKGFEFEVCTDNELAQLGLYRGRPDHGDEPDATIDA